MKYVLVLKDAMSGFVELVGCRASTAEETYHGLLDWLNCFRVVHQWVSDQDTHFKNQVAECLRRALGTQRHFVTTYCPCTNGTVEVVNRKILRGLKALLSERKPHMSE